MENEFTKADNDVKRPILRGDEDEFGKRESISSLHERLASLEHATLVRKHSTRADDKLEKENRRLKQQLELERERRQVSEEKYKEYRRRKDESRGEASEELKHATKRLTAYMDENKQIKAHLGKVIEACEKLKERLTISLEREKALIALCGKFKEAYQTGQLGELFPGLDSQLAKSIDTNIRSEWKTSSAVEIFSTSRNNWFKGVIAKIKYDEQGEWLEVVYQIGSEQMRKDVQRLDDTIIRPFGDKRPKRPPRRTTMTDALELPPRTGARGPPRSQPPIIAEGRTSSRHGSDARNDTDDEEEDSMLAHGRRRGPKSSTNFAKQFDTKTGQKKGKKGKKIRAVVISHKGVVVRRGEGMKTPKITTLSYNSEVEVIRKKNRRCEISKPFKGWITWQKQDGTENIKFKDKGSGGSGDSGLRSALTVYKERITGVFQMHNPSKVGSVSQLLEKYRDELHALYLRICDKYDLEPDPEYKPGDFLVGDQVSVHSTSRKIWFDDGEIEQVEPGRVLVSYNQGMKTKWMNMGSPNIKLRKASEF